MFQQKKENCTRHKTAQNFSNFSGFRTRFLFRKRGLPIAAVNTCPVQYFYVCCRPALLKAPIGYCKKVTERLAPSSFKLSGVADLWRVPPPPHTPTVKHYTVAKAVLWKVAVLRMKSLLLMPEHFAPRPYWYFTFLHPKNVFRSL